MPSAAGVSLLSAVLQKSLSRAQKNYTKSNPPSASKLKESQKLRNFVNFSSICAKYSVKSKNRNELEDLNPESFSWSAEYCSNPLYTEFEPAPRDYLNFVERIKSKYTCLNPPKEQRVNLIKKKQAPNSINQTNQDNKKKEEKIKVKKGDKKRAKKAEKKLKKELKLKSKLGEDICSTSTKNADSPPPPPQKLSKLEVLRLQRLERRAVRKSLKKLKKLKMRDNLNTTILNGSSSNSSEELSSHNSTSTNNTTTTSTNSSSKSLNTPPTFNSLISSNTFVNFVKSINAPTNIVKSKASSNENNNGKSSSSNGPEVPKPKFIIYPKERVCVGWKTALHRGCGFYNLGNSCYMNATLQAIFHIPSVVNWLLSDEEHRRKCNNAMKFQQCMVCAMQVTLRESLQKQNHCIRPIHIHNNLRVISKNFFHGRQEDAHEFLRYLLESMERSYLRAIEIPDKLDSRSKETTPIGQIFGGYLRTEVFCPNPACKYVSTTFQPLAELQLDIRNATSVEEAVRLHFTMENLGNNDYRCEKCVRVVGAKKQFSLEIPPTVLCLQLKRFTLYGGKINRQIHCNRFLDMNKYLYGPQKDKKLRYRLVSLITHIGSSPNGGHYTAVAEASDRNFYQFDDMSVRQLTVDTAFNTDAYIIIYEREREMGNVSECSSPSISLPNGFIKSPLSSSTLTSNSMPKKQTVVMNPLFNNKGKQMSFSNNNKVNGTSSSTGSSMTKLVNSSPGFGPTRPNSPLAPPNERTKIQFSVSREGSKLSNGSSSKNTNVKIPQSAQYLHNTTPVLGTKPNSTHPPPPPSKRPNGPLVPYGEEESDSDSPTNNGRKNSTSPSNRKRERPLSPPNNGRRDSSSPPNEKRGREVGGANGRRDSSSPVNEKRGREIGGANGRRDSSSPANEKRGREVGGANGRRDSSSPANEKRGREVGGANGRRDSSSSANGRRDSSSPANGKRQGSLGGANGRRDSTSPANGKRDREVGGANGRSDRSSSPFSSKVIVGESKVKSWNGEESRLSMCVEEERKRSLGKRSEEELYNEELDIGRAKKRKLSSSRSPSAPHDNKFQNYEDKRRLVDTKTQFLANQSASSSSNFQPTNNVTQFSKLNISSGSNSKLANGYSRSANSSPVKFQHNNNNSTSNYERTNEDNSTYFNNRNSFSSNKYFNRNNNTTWSSKFSHGGKFKSFSGGRKNYYGGRNGYRTNSYHR